MIAVEDINGVLGEVFSQNISGMRPKHDILAAQDDDISLDLALKQAVELIC